eukprot:COSAG02_NODE_7574_length_2955_cov_12.315476_1_plen_39_part_10
MPREDRIGRRPAAAPARAGAGLGRGCAIVRRDTAYQHGA